MNDLPSFQKASMKPIRQFQEAVSYPVSKNEFKQSLESKISCSNSWFGFYINHGYYTRIFLVTNKHMDDKKGLF